MLSAFFLEASFLAILLFGGKRVPRWLHVLSAVVVAIGTATSAFWILSANSWMQTPTGHEMRDGIAYPVDWFAIVFNPSFPYRFAHMLNASYLTAGFVVLAVGARYLLKGDHVEEARTMMRMAIGLLVVLAPLQIWIGDEHGLNTLKHQPIKIAAMEAHWDGSKPGDFYIFAWPDERAETNRFAIAVPYGSSLVLTHKWDGLFPGLKDVPPADRPPLVSVFFAFRIMIGIGFFMAAAVLFGAFLWLRGKLFDTRWYLLVMAQTWWLGFVAVICGWIVTESGRQPWIVQGILRTADATSPVIGPAIAVTFALFVIVYGIIFSAGIYFINRLIAKGLEIAEGDEPSLARRRCVRRGRQEHGRRRLTMEWYLPLIWAGIIGTAVALYVILDGFDLGIGMLFPFARDDAERDQMMASIAPFWDGNETWLVMGGVGLLVAFPLAYAVIMPAMYLPVIVMLLALVFRGVAFEFREIGHSKALVEHRLCRRLDLGGLLPGRDPRRHDPGHPGRERRLRGRAVRLGNAFRSAVRPRRSRRLCAARRNLAGDEDQWTGGRTGAKSRHLAALRGAGVHGGGQPVDAAGVPADQGALVFAAQFSLSLAGAASDRADGVRRLGRAADGQ